MFMDRLKQENPDLIATEGGETLSAVFEMADKASYESQLQLHSAFSDLLGHGQQVFVSAMTEEFLAVAIVPKNNNVPYAAETLESFANASMFDALAQKYSIRSIDFSDEDFHGGIDYQS